MTGYQYASYHHQYSVCTAQYNHRDSKTFFSSLSTSQFGFFSWSPLKQLQIRL